VESHHRNGSVFPSATFYYINGRGLFKESRFFFCKRIAMEPEGKEING